MRRKIQCKLPGLQPGYEVQKVELYLSDLHKTKTFLEVPALTFAWMKTHPPPPFPMNLKPCVSMVRIDLNGLQRSQNNLHLHGKCGKHSNNNSKWMVSSDSMFSLFSTIFPMSISLIYIHRTIGTNLIQTSPNVLLHSKYLTPCKMTLTK